jgi:hypothetical protein
VALLLPHVQSVLELVNRCVMDEERTDALMRLSYGLIGDLADCFPNGQIKQLLLANWIAAEFRTRHRMPEETKKILRWAREVCPCSFHNKIYQFTGPCSTDGQKGHTVESSSTLPFCVENFCCSLFLLYHFLPVSLCLFHAIIRTCMQSVYSLSFSFLVIS